ncbi:MAG: hypothetical protein V4510_10255 [bacterium]
MQAWWSMVAVLCLLVAGCGGKSTDSPTSGPNTAPSSAPGPAGPGALPPAAVRPVNPDSPTGNTTLTSTGAPDPSAIDALTAPWWFFPVTSSDAGSLAGFRWVVPASAPHDYQGRKEISFEVGPVIPAGATVGALQLFIFTLEDGKASQLMSIGSMPLEYRIQTSPGVPAAFHATTPSFAPSLATMSATGLEAGKTIGIVVVAKGGTAPTGYAMRVLDHHIDYSKEDADKTQADMIANFTVHGQGAQMAPHGTGTGFDDFLYYGADFVYGTAPNVFTFAYELRTTPAAYTSATPTSPAPGLAIRDGTFTADSGFAQGWGISDVTLVHDRGAGTFDVNIDCFGNKKVDSQPLVGAPTQLNWAIAVAIAEGSGGCHTSATVQAIGASSYAGASMNHVAMGATLTTLIGTPSIEAGYATHVPSAQMQGRDLALDLSTGTVILAGAAPQAS